MSIDTLFIIFVAAPAAGLLGVIIARAAWARRRGPRPADQEPAHAGERPAYGADPQFGRELHDLRDAEVSPELVSEIEVELAWAMAWHDFEQALHAQVERIFAPVEAALTEPRSFAELRDLLDLPGELVTAC